MSKVIMHKEDFFKIHNRVQTRNIEINNDTVTFEADQNALTFIKNTGYDYNITDSFKIKMGVILKKYYMVIIGFIFLFSIIYINTFRVSKIIFNTQTPINSKIENQLKSQYKDLFCFSFSNIDYQELSAKLRMEYSEYPYINVYSKNNNIQVDIYTYNDEYNELELSGTSGNIVAKKDGLISYYYIYQGENKASVNKYVKKGDLLVSGFINNKSIGAKALIMANTYEKIEVEVLKKESIAYETGNNDNYYEVSFFNNSFPISKKNEFALVNKSEKNVFNLFDLFKIKKIEEKEKNVIIEENTLEAACSKGEKLIKDNFESNKSFDEEKIIDLKMYMYNEDEKSYKITYIVKKLESIGDFKEINANEVESTN